MIFQKVSFHPLDPSMQRRETMPKRHAIAIGFEMIGGAYYEAREGVRSTVPCIRSRSFWRWRD